MFKKIKFFGLNVDAIRDIEILLKILLQNILIECCCIRNERNRDIKNT